MDSRVQDIIEKTINGLDNELRALSLKVQPNIDLILLGWSIVNTDKRHRFTNILNSAITNSTRMIC